MSGSRSLRSSRRRVSSRRPTDRSAWSLHPYLDTPTPHAIAHRGGALTGVENSMAAFEDAVSLGYRYLETDVRVTRDGVLLAFHDATLDRTTDQRGVIAELDWEDVRRARIGGREPIPHLHELFDAWPDIRINIDAKEDIAVDPLAEYLEANSVLDRVLVGSFSDERLERLRSRFGPALCTSAGPREIRRLRFASVVHAPSLLAPVAADCVQIPPRHGWLPLADRRMVHYCHRRGLPVHVWTIDSPVEMHRLLDLGVDGLMTDDCRRLKDVLEVRGEWTGNGR